MARVAQGGENEDAVGVDLDVFADGEDAQGRGGFGQYRLAEPVPMGAVDPEVLAVAADAQGRAVAAGGVRAQDDLDTAGEGEVADGVQGELFGLLTEPGVQAGPPTGAGCRRRDAPEQGTPTRRRRPVR